MDTGELTPLGQLIATTRKLNLATAWTFDWLKAARIIKESGCKTASAGLWSDYTSTCFDIFKDGKPLVLDPKYICLTSCWAQPVLEVGGVYRWCFIPNTDARFDPSIVWPEEALAILNK